MTRTVPAQDHKQTNSTPILNGQPGWRVGDIFLWETVRSGIWTTIKDVVGRITFIKKLVLRQEIGIQNRCDNRCEETKHIQFGWSTSFENASLFQQDWYIKVQFEHRLELPNYICTSSPWETREECQGYWSDSRRAVETTDMCLCMSMHVCTQRDTHAHTSEWEYMSVHAHLCMCAHTHISCSSATLFYHVCYEPHLGTLVEGFSNSRWHPPITFYELKAETLPSTRKCHVVSR